MSDDGLVATVEYLWGDDCPNCGDFNNLFLYLGRAWCQGCIEDDLRKYGLRIDNPPKEWLR